nr:MAG TPA: hypothetical protein [Caudoviricetes sp.]
MSVIPRDNGVALLARSDANQTGDEQIARARGSRFLTPMNMGCAHGPDRV